MKENVWTGATQACGLCENGSDVRKAGAENAVLRLFAAQITGSEIRNAGKFCRRPRHPAWQNGRKAVRDAIAVR